MLSPNKIEIFRAVRNVRLVFVLPKVLLEKVYLSFIIVYQKRNNIVKADETLNL